MKCLQMLGTCLQKITTAPLALRLLRPAGASQSGDSKRYLPCPTSTFLVRNAGDHPECILLVHTQRSWMIYDVINEPDVVHTRYLSRSPNPISLFLIYIPNAPPRFGPSSSRTKSQRPLKVALGYKNRLAGSQGFRMKTTPFRD